MGRALPGPAGRRSASSASPPPSCPTSSLPHADFIVSGEPEEAVLRLAAGETLSGYVKSEEIADLDTLPFPRWDLVGVTSGTEGAAHAFTRPLGAFSLLASRSCPEFCTYCPHRILSSYRSRSVQNLVEELAQLSDDYPQALRGLPRSALQPGARAHPRPLRRDPLTRPRPALGVRDAPRPARRRAAHDHARRRASRHHLRRGVALRRDPAQGRTPPDPGGSSAAGDRDLPASRHRHRGLLRPRASRPTPGTRSPPPSSTRSPSAPPSRSSSCSRPTPALRSTSRWSGRSSRRTGSASTASPRPSATRASRPRRCSSSWPRPTAASTSVRRSSRTTGAFQKGWLLDLVARLDRRVPALHARKERGAAMSEAVEMLTAISRYGARCVPDFEQIVERCRREGTWCEGPERPRSRTRSPDGWGAAARSPPPTAAWPPTTS